MSPCARPTSASGRRNGKRRAASYRAKRRRVKGTGACRALWAKQAGGASEIARSAACGTTMRVSRTKSLVGSRGTLRLSYQVQHLKKK